MLVEELIQPKLPGRSPCNKDGMGPVLLGGSCERGKVPCPRNKLCCLDQPEQNGSFRGLKKSAVIGLSRQKREISTPGLGHLAALPSSMNVSASAGWGWVLNLGFQRTDLGRGWGWPCRESLKGPECGLSGNWGCVRTWVYYRSPLVKEHLKGEVGPQQSSPTECSQRAGLCEHMSACCCPTHRWGWNLSLIRRLCDFSGFTLPLVPL